MITMQAVENGVLIQVRVLPGAKKNEIRGEQNGSLKISVTQPPEKGKANKSVQDQLEKKLGLRKSQIQIVSGETNPQKKFLVIGVGVDELSKLIAPFLVDRESH